MKRFGFSLLALLILVPAFMACTSNKVEERPLWTDTFTVNQVFPSDTFVTGIGKGKDSGIAIVNADADLAAYFVREITAERTGSQVMTSDDEDGHIQEKLINTVTVKSQIDLAGVKRTDPWFDKKTKEYIVCSYLERKETWKKQEPVIAQAKENFYSFLNAAEREYDPFKKIDILKEAKSAAKDYEEKILFSELLYKQGCKAYSSDRKVIAELDEKISSVARNVSFRVYLDSDTDSRLGKRIEKIVTDNGFNVSENGDYQIIGSLKSGKEIFEETIVSNPELVIEVNNSKSTILSFTKTLDRIVVFAEAEGMLSGKINKAAEKTIQEDFAPLFAALWK